MAGSPAARGVGGIIAFEGYADVHEAGGKALPPLLEWEG
jgi:hypothetical protein